MTSFGTGQPIREIYPWLADQTQRHNMILDVVERDSIIEGLPPFDEPFREEILRQLRQVTIEPSEVLEMPAQSLARNPS